MGFLDPRICGEQAREISKQMNIDQIKASISIIDYLGAPVKVTANGYLYRCPWREDVHPSLSVTKDGRGWHDLATGEHGNIIDLAMKVLHTTDFSTICRHFTENSFSFSPSESFDEQREKRSSFSKFEVLKMVSPGLFAYLHQRGISAELGKQFCREARYSFTEGNADRYLYALAFQNDKGGYELRNPRFKASYPPKGITPLQMRENAPYVVFEGFFDLLSFITMCGGIKHNYVVLNSIINLPDAIEVLQHQERVFLCLDNDDAGRAATSSMRDSLGNSRVIDIAPRMLPFKDVNEYLQNAFKKG